jgi:hypothetical protein
MQTCLDEKFTIKSADDKIMKGNMDYDEFVLNSRNNRLKAVVLSIEVKGPWQLDVEPWETLVDFGSLKSFCTSLIGES